MMDSPTEHHDATHFAQRLVSVDLEVGQKDNTIYQIGVAYLNGQTMHLHNMATKKYMELDAFCQSGEIVVGHNFIAFDFQHLQHHFPELRLLKKPVLDTLWLNPLAFASNPYHSLIKHYQDPNLLSTQVNNPVHDAEAVLKIVLQQFIAMRAIATTRPDLVAAWHGLAAIAGGQLGFEAFFRAVRQQAPPNESDCFALIKQLLQGSTCSTALEENLQAAKIPDVHARWSWAYVLAWHSVAGTNSVMPPWVRQAFPLAATLVRALRNTPCGKTSCRWCSTRHNALHELQKWFPHIPGFRPDPANAKGVSLQQVIVESAMQSKHVLAILPTGTGKSVCYQLPALSLYEKTGALTLVISPLVALMQDQVNNLSNQSILCSAALSGLLSMPERKDVLQRIRMGDVGILLLAPEQLRNRTVRRALEQREIGAWVLDEAHCLSKWGHDFRPDYRYVGRFIKQQAENGSIPPILCLTATAKPDVVQELQHYFSETLGVTLQVENGGSSRNNLTFEVVKSTSASKTEDLQALLHAALANQTSGVAIVYCALRNSTEKLAQHLQQLGWAANFYHGGMAPTAKKSVQDQFIAGSLRVIVATNAFGMGIDKPDVRLVVHFDMPGSLENYLQEAGRAGRDRQPARCVLLYAAKDVERQFGLNAMAMLYPKDIQAVLKTLRKLARKKQRDGEIVITPGEILREDTENLFHRLEDRATDDTRVKTAVTWLEESELLQRHDNVVSVFSSSLKVKTVQEAQFKLQRFPQIANQAGLIKIVSLLINAPTDKGLSTDELMAETGLSHVEIRSAMHDLEVMGICNNDMAMTIYVNTSPKNHSHKSLAFFTRLERIVIDALRIAYPDLEQNGLSLLNLRQLTQQVRDEVEDPDAVHTDVVQSILKSLVDDGRRSGKQKTLRMRKQGELVEVRLLANWSDLRASIDLRCIAAQVVVNHLLGSVPTSSRSDDVLVKTTVSQLEHSLKNDISLQSATFDVVQLLERALLWLHGLKIIQLNKGLSVFRSAMTLKVLNSKRGFTKADYVPLQLHYREQVEQIHIMRAYAEHGIVNMKEALALSSDYFSLVKSDFMKRWFPNRAKELERQTSPESYHKIVDSLGQSEQKNIVKDDREKTSVLVLAGPGSGKTRVLVHRIAYLVRVRRVKPESILALTYNRHAAVEIRRRLYDLIGADASQVLVMTCHGMAMRLVGVSFHDANKNTAQSELQKKLDTVLDDATALLKGEGLAPEEADEQRDRLLAGFEWILVDEYQDISEKHYALISALAGRTTQDPEQKLSLFAVGDDDQNIYEFNGASVRFIKQFESDYAAKTAYLVENYRSTRHIIDAANTVIAQAAERMKSEHPIRVNKARELQPAGGELEHRDGLAQGKVQILHFTHSPHFAKQQAVAVVDEMVRLSGLLADWQWSQCAIIAREWSLLSPVRSYCEALNIPVQLGNEAFGSVWRLRETQVLIQWIASQGPVQVSLDAVQEFLVQAEPSPWNALLQEGIEGFRLDTGFKSVLGHTLIDWIAEWGREFRRKQNGILLISAHRAKGLEFDHVAVLDGSWHPKQGPLNDEVRRLFYVAMTRAKHSLLLASSPSHPYHATLQACPSVLVRSITGMEPLPAPVHQHYDVAELRDVDLSFAGRVPARDRMHAAIGALRTGSPLWLQTDGEKYYLHDANGVRVGAMARHYRPPPHTQFLRASVFALHTRWRDDAEAAFAHRIQVNQWFVVVPEIIYQEAAA